MNSKLWKEDGTRTDEYILSLVHQLSEWIKGKWIHNEFSDECTPDFGCCTPSMRMSKNERNGYVIKKLREFLEKGEMKN